MLGSLPPSPAAPSSPQAPAIPHWEQHLLFSFSFFFFSLMEEVKSSVYLAKKKKIPGIPPAPSLNITKRPSCSPRGELLQRASSTLPREERRQQGALQGPTCSTRTGDVEKTHSSQCSAGQGRGLLCEPRSSPSLSVLVVQGCVGSLRLPSAPHLITPCIHLDCRRV